MWCHRPGGWRGLQPCLNPKSPRRVWNDVYIVKRFRLWGLAKDFRLEAGVSSSIWLGFWVLLLISWLSWNPTGTQEFNTGLSSLSLTVFSTFTFINAPRIDQPSLATFPGSVRVLDKSCILHLYIYILLIYIFTYIYVDTIIIANMDISKSRCVYLYMSIICVYTYMYMYIATWICRMSQ